MQLYCGISPLLTVIIIPEVVTIFISVRHYVNKSGATTGIILNVCLCFLMLPAEKLVTC